MIIFSVWEMCISQTVPLCSWDCRCVAEPERMKSMSQLAVLTRRWCPAQMKLEPFREVVLESSSVDELKEKVMSRWPVFNFYITSIPDVKLTLMLMIREGVSFSWCLFPCSSVKWVRFLLRTWSLPRYDGLLIEFRDLRFRVFNVLAFSFNAWVHSQDQCCALLEKGIIIVLGFLKLGLILQPNE